MTRFKLRAMLQLDDGTRTTRQLRVELPDAAQSSPAALVRAAAERLARDRETAKIISTTVIPPIGGLR